MAQWLEVLTVLPEVLNSIPSNYIVAHNQLKWNLMPFSCIKVYMQIEHSYMWENGLYSVNYILNKCLLANSQTGSIGRTTRQEVEVGQ